MDYTLIINIDVNQHKTSTIGTINDTKVFSLAQGIIVGKFDIKPKIGRMVMDPFNFTVTGWYGDTEIMYDLTFYRVVAKMDDTTTDEKTTKTSGLTIKLDPVMITTARTEEGTFTYRFPYLKSMVEGNAIANVVVIVEFKIYSKTFDHISLVTITLKQPTEDDIDEKIQEEINSGAFNNMGESFDNLIMQSNYFYHTGIRIFRVKISKITTCGSTCPFFHY